ncbi:hypothetical protein FACS1894200_14420 [Spirochaetia bacterium]|nr:hypothetical protein FACS1894200_14420 [Spirochaetia bacterium]
MSLPHLKLLWKIEIDDATVDDYIIHGELSISRINSEGNILWKKFSSDVFATSDFKIVENNIYAKTSEGTEYKFDYDGKVE